MLPESLSNIQRKAFAWSRANPFAALARLRQLQGAGGLVASTLTYLAFGAVSEGWMMFVAIIAGNLLGGGAALLSVVSHLPRGDWRIGMPFYFCAVLQTVGPVYAWRHFQKVS